MAILTETCAPHGILQRWCDPCQRETMSRRVVAESLAETRARAVDDAWRGMEEHMAARLPRLCRDAVVAMLVRR